jgi:hypothetical protein
VSAPTPDRKKKVAVAGLVALLIVPLLAISFPYYRSVKTEYEAFHAYVAQTLEDPQAVPPWGTETPSPEGCVGAAIAWGEACPGAREFCKGSVPEVVRRCLEVSDRTAWCSAQGQAWMTGRFGYHDCEARLEGLEGQARRRRESYCAFSWAKVGRHCAALDLPAP